MTGLQPEDFDALDDILDNLRTRYEETPQWEFCEGFLVALICCRRAIPETEWLPVLLGLEDDEGADVRGAIASLPPEERAEIASEEIPAFAQVWALGFMFVVENWPDEWTAPKDKETAQWHDTALEAIVALTEDDTEEPTLSALSEDGPLSVSESRLNVYGEALWAVYDLREIWRNRGPRVVQVIKDATPGRNDVCSCGSGKKYKKCCGAN